MTNDLRCPDLNCDEKDHPYFSLTVMVDADRTLCERVDKLDPEDFTCTHCGAKAVDVPDRCGHGMFFTGAGACPQCGGGAENGESPRDQVERELHKAGVIEDPDMDGGLLG